LLSNLVLICLLIFMFVRAFCVRNGLKKRMTLFIRRSTRTGVPMLTDGSGEYGANGGIIAGGQNGQTAEKKRRLSSRELMTLEMTSVGSNAYNPYEDTEVVDISAVNPMLKNKNKNNGRKNWNKLKQTLKTDHFKEMRKSKVRRLSNIMKKKQQNELDFHKEVEDDLGNIDVLEDTDGRRYSYNHATEECLWIDPELEVVGEGERKGETQEEKQEPHEGKSQKDTSQNELEFDIDEASGRRYSYNKQTGVSSWIDDEPVP